MADISALSKWDISSADSLDGMFDECHLLEDISALSSWDVSNVKSMNGMFNNCSSLVDVSGLASWNISQNTSLDFIFKGCDQLEDYPSWFKIEVIRNTNFDSRTRHKIINGLNESFFRTFNLNSFNEDTQLFIVAACNNQPLLAYIADRSNFDFIQEKAVEKVTDESVLADIAINDHNCDIFNQNGNLKFYFYNRERAFVKIKDHDILVDVAKKMPHMLVNIDQMNRYVLDEESWMDIVIGAQSQEMRVFALAHIKDVSSFENIINESNDEEIIMISRHKIGLNDE